MPECRRSRRPSRKITMLATILGFLTALFNNGGDLLKQVMKIFQGNPQSKKEQVDRESQSEESRRDAGGRPG